MPFVIPSFKLYVYSPNLNYDIKMSNEQKDYKILTIDEFQKNYNCDLIIDEILENIFLTKDNQIIKTKSGTKLLCSVLNMNRTTFSQRRAYGWSLSEIINEKIIKKSKKENNNNSNHTNFKLTKEISNQLKTLNIHTTLYRYRIKKGMSHEEALKKPRKRKITTIDHLGNHYNSLKEMCQYYNINPSVFNKRLNRKWTIEKALTTPTTKKNGKPKTVTDHKGNHYNSINDMAKTYNINPKTLYARLQSRCPIKKALTLK